jgi:hypothetical protein
MVVKLIKHSLSINQATRIYAKHSSNKQKANNVFVSSSLSYIHLIYTHQQNITLLDTLYPPANPHHTFRRIHPPAGPDPSSSCISPGPRSCDRRQHTHHAHTHRVLHGLNLVGYPRSPTIHHENCRDNTPVRTRHVSVGHLEKGLTHPDLPRTDSFPGLLLVDEFGYPQMEGLNVAKSCLKHATRGS